MVKQTPAMGDHDTYKVDFTWKKLKGIITDNKTNAHVMDIDCKKFTKPHAVFKDPEDKTIGTASFNVVSIHAECEVRGRAKRVQAMKRWATEYTYLSDAFAEGGLPVPMYWTSSSGFKHWDFILLDSNKEPVARFHSNVWAYKKLGLVEFMGHYPAKAKEEICITGFTVYYNTLLRMNNLFQFFGAMGAKTGPLDPNASGTEIPMQSKPSKEPGSNAQASVVPLEASKGTAVH